MTPAVEALRAPLYESGLIDGVTGGLLRPGGLALTDRAVACCALPPGSRVLDLGCGTGATVNHLRSSLGLRAVGLDRSAVLLQRARRETAEAPLLRADGAALPLVTGTMDAVLMECVLSVTPNPSAVLAECRRVLAPRGRLAMSDLYDRGAGCDELFGMLGRGGFAIQLWEDHSRALTELAARLVMANGALPPLCELKRGTRPGYFLLVASKAGESEGEPS